MLAESDDVSRIVSMIDSIGDDDSTTCGTDSDCPDGQKCEIRGSTRSCKDEATAASCDASAPPTNGQVGTCTDTLASGVTCQPVCNAGFTVSGTSSCSSGTLTAATCSWTNGCAVGCSDCSNLGSSSQCNVCDQSLGYYLLAKGYHENILTGHCFQAHGRKDGAVSKYDDTTSTRPSCDDICASTKTDPTVFVWDSPKFICTRLCQYTIPVSDLKEFKNCTGSTGYNATGSVCHHAPSADGVQTKFKTGSANGGDISHVLCNFYKRVDCTPRDSYNRVKCGQCTTSNCRDSKCKDRTCTVKKVISVAAITAKDHSGDPSAEMVEAGRYAPMACSFIASTK